MDTREFGEKRIIEFISNESEYGDDERALFRLCRNLLGRGLVRRELAEKRRIVHYQVKVIMEVAMMTYQPFPRGTGKVNENFSEMKFQFQGCKKSIFLNQHYQ